MSNSRIRLKPLHSLWSVARLNPHMSRLFCCCDLGCRERRQEACLLTQLSVYADFTSHPPAVLAALPSNPSLLPFPHLALLLLDQILFTHHNLHISYITPPSLVQFQLCILLPFHLSPPHLHPSSISFPSLPSLSNPSRLVAWPFWQPSVELIHEPVLGQCNQPLFMAYYQIPGAELFYCRTIAFCCVIEQLSPTQRE